MQKAGEWALLGFASVSKAWLLPSALASLFHYCDGTSSGSETPYRVGLSCSCHGSAVIIGSHQDKLQPPKTSPS